MVGVKREIFYNKAIKTLEHMNYSAYFVHMYVCTAQNYKW